MLDMISMMKQAHQMQGKVKQIQKKLGKVRVEGQAGDGKVRVRMNGKFEAISVQIDDTVHQGKKDVLETLVCAAFCDAAALARQETEAKYKDAFGDSLPPGMTLPS